ncbi:hypothetical protein ACHAWF_005569 [Thalassiosira exigua]
MHLTWIPAVLAATMVVKIDGFAPSCRPKISRSTNIDFTKSHKLRDQRLMSSTTAAIEIPSLESQRSLNRVQSKIVKALMVTYIASMCIALPATLFPIFALYKARLIDRVRKEKWSLKAGQFCSRWLMRIFPFASKRVVVDADDKQRINPEPSIYVCNHISMLDLFFVLALDRKMRGRNRRPIKILYWKGLEANPVTSLLCKMCGFIPVEMSDNGNGNANEYDPKSFKQMLKATKAAIEEGFDIGILPEGQPNPTPENGLQPIYSGAFTLARMSRRPIQMIGLYGLHRMWHPTNGMDVSARDMAVRVYPGGRIYKDSEKFTTTFEAVVGHFGAHGRDLPDSELKLWLDGSMWQTELSRRAATRMEIEDVDQEIKSKNSTDASAQKLSLGQK